MRSESDARRSRIEEIASRITDLSTELEELLLQKESSVNSSTRSTARGLRVSNTPRRPQPEVISVGDRIIITNNYRGHRGQTGTVIEVEPNGGYIHF